MKFFIKRNNHTRRGCTRIKDHGFAVVLILVFMFISPFLVMAQAPEGKDTTEERKVTTARDAFTYLNIPALEILKRTTRLDMLDYWDADSIYKATNAMNGLSWIEKCTTDYMKVQLTPVSTLELKMLPSKKDGIVTMAVYTVGNQAQSEDSEISFTDEKLHQLDSKKLFKQPKLEDFFDIPKGSLTSMKEIKEMIPFPTVAYSASPDNDDLKARLTVEAYMNVDDYNIVKLFLKPYVTLKWNGKEFKVEK